MPRLYVLFAFLCALTSLGCSASIDSTGRDQVVGCDLTEPVVSEDGSSTICVDATSREEWTLIHLEDGLVNASQGWDLAFRRFSVRTNGGGSGTGTGAGQLVDAMNISGVDFAPDSGWIDDGADADELVFSEWYSYNGDTHKLTPVSGVWLVRGGHDQRYYALQITSYYDSAGDSGIYTLRWSALSPPMVLPDLTPGTGALPMPTDNPQSGASGGDEMSGDAGVPAAASYGCYSGPPDHQCDCDGSQEQCDEIGGTWTEECTCDE